jgi:hypothetical protein
MKVQRVARKVHKWLGLVLAIQLFFWIAGGLVMSAIPLEKVHGKQLAVKTLPHAFISSDYTYSVQAIIDDLRSHSSSARDFMRVTEVQFLSYDNQPAYLIQSPTAQVLISATTGARFLPLNELSVKNLAVQHYIYEDNPDKTIHSVDLLQRAPQEASRASGKVWRVNFDDIWHTSLYFSDESLQLVSIRSDIWRVFDFVWMLHIMDYEEREDFNNPLLIVFAATSVCFTITGMIMLLRSFRFRRRSKLKP